ncbi:unnamed protein product, partial [Prorocentrum cordatum]
PCPSPLRRSGASGMPPRRRFMPRTLAECRRALGEVDDPGLGAALMDTPAGDGGPHALLSKPKPGDWLDSREELGQSFPQYAKRMGPRGGQVLPRQGCDGLLVCPVGSSFSEGVGALFMPHLLRFYAAFFPGMTVEVLEKPLSLSGVRSRENDFKHRQYLIGDVFTMLHTHKDQTIDVVSRRSAYTRLAITLEDIHTAADIPRG